MTFDEAIEHFRNNTDISGTAVFLDDVEDTLKELQEEYAPTIEMTKTQYVFITSEYEQKNIVDAVANLTVDDILKENFHQSFWKPLTQNEVVQAWLHPETIKVVDE
ncbi:hypothetical protein [Leuconostoc lactis]|uniref:hypothetical protein n=1 Tax=Leuconostoc lactis TaxID=1246 RepID=UPI000E9D7409|nr:hypothetical protein [Leuconostoc lactis]HBP98119.1 hypothetical protein [Leuconostoc lactis]